MSKYMSVSDRMSVGGDHLKMVMVKIKDVFVKQWLPGLSVYCMIFLVMLIVKYGQTVVHYTSIGQYWWYITWMIVDYVPFCSTLSIAFHYVTCNDLDIIHIHHCKSVIFHVYLTLVGGLEHFYFSIIYGIILPIDFHIFQGGYCTTNQL